MFIIIIDSSAERAKICCITLFLEYLTTARNAHPQRESEHKARQNRGTAINKIAYLRQNALTLQR